MPGQNMVDIRGLPASVVLAALFNNARLDGRRPTASDERMSVAEAEAIIHVRLEDGFVGKLRGRTIGVDFSRPQFDASHYDAMNASSDGGVHAQEVIAHLRALLTTERLAEATKVLPPRRVSGSGGLRT